MNTSLESKVKEKLQVVSTVQEEVVAALEKNGIVEPDRLDIILPALSSVLQISKAEDGTYSTVLISAAGEPLTKDDKTPWTIADWISDYVFESSLPAGAEGSIPFKESGSLSDEDLQAVASGKKVILPPKKSKPDKDAIPSSDGREMSRNVEGIASGKTKVNMNK